MARTITVKVATPKVINALETKLDKIKSDYANQEQFEAEYQAELKAWNDSLLEYAKSRLDTATNLRTGYRAWNNTLNVDFDVDTRGADFPLQPERKFEQIAQYQYKEAVEEITNALSILKMTDEETVNASTMKSIARYL
jgi:carotenoid cleavage dioxygenase-like enzyme